MFLFFIFISSSFLAGQKNNLQVVPAVEKTLVFLDQSNSYFDENPH